MGHSTSRGRRAYGLVNACGRHGEAAAEREKRWKTQLFEGVGGGGQGRGQ